MNPIRVSPLLGSHWYFAGLSSTFPDAGLDDSSLSQIRLCGGRYVPSCKAFRISEGDNNLIPKQLIQVELDKSFSDDTNLKGQILVFQYKGKFHAIDHVRLYDLHCCQY